MLLDLALLTSMYILNKQTLEKSRMPSRAFSSLHPVNTRDKIL